MSLIESLFIGFGVSAIILALLIILLLPLICTIILGTYFATQLGLTGIVWWSFVILFYLIIAGILGLIGLV